VIGGHWQAIARYYGSAIKAAECPILSPLIAERDGHGTTLVAISVVAVRDCHSGWYGEETSEMANLASQSGVGHVAKADALIRPVPGVSAAW